MASAQKGCITRLQREYKSLLRVSFELLCAERAPAAVLLLLLQAGVPP
jgi:hypothetical protein